MAESILVTGGAGFIGSNFIRFVLKNNDVKIINLDALTYAGNPENLRDIENDDNYTFIHGRIQDFDLVAGIFDKYDISGVINFAAESHVDRSIMDARPFIDTNVKGTLVLLDNARKHGVEKFLQVSTDEVYGSLGEHGKFTEGSPVKPNSPYSASKASADHLVTAYRNTYGMPVMITRCSNNYGRYQFPEKLIPLMILNAKENKKLPVYGDGKNVRDWIHVLDHAEALWTVYSNGKAGEIYNIGGNSEMPNITIVRKILDILDKPENLIEFVKDRPGHDRRYAIDNSKIRNELGWSPKVDLESGLEMTVKWYLENPEWTERVRSGEYLNYYEKQYGNFE